jgi:hypothetical protein
LAAKAPYHRGVRGSAPLAALEAEEHAAYLHLLRPSVGEGRELLAEGPRPDRIAACIETVRRRAARGGHAGEAP